MQRFFDVPEGARLDGLHGALVAALPGDDDGRHIAKLITQLAQQGQAIHAGKFHVSQDHRGTITRKRRQGLFGASHAKHVTTPLAQERFIAEASVFLILDDEYFVQALYGFRHRDESIRRPGPQPSDRQAAT